MTKWLSQDTGEMLRPIDAARMIGVTTRTLKRYEADGKITPDVRLPSGHRRYSRATIEAFLAHKAAA